ncbi:MAG: hypothetical protein LBL63_01175, partial [Clostridiales Family XIII bacterium]|nr:hypothetical protein [Clostridiales Family XIII bacterium]
MKMRTFARKFPKPIVVGALVALLISMSAGEALAYFNLPAVGISPGQTAVSLTVGQTVTVSVGVSPASEEQLPGCGMAECPQTCGVECLDARGWCQCAGMTYSTYYAQVSAASSNSSVAQARYGSGTLTLTGVSPGTANVTLTALLEKHQPGNAVVSVTVNAAPGNSNSGSNSGSSAGAGS